MLTIDIESCPIEDGAPLLPKPVGFALRWPNGDAGYYSFGHPSENNCTWDEARAVLLSIWNEPWITHNGLTFDVPVLTHWFKMPPRDPLLTHDTLFLAYLHNPHAPSVALKDLAKSLLRLEATERDALRDWIMSNTDCRSLKKTGSYIYLAPGGLVGRYAMADVAMTYALFQHLQSVIETMGRAYDRERRLAPILTELQHRGVRVDVERLEADYVAARARLHFLDEQVRSTLYAPDLCLDSNVDLAVALQGAGYRDFLRTPKGSVSVGQDSLEKALAAVPEFAAVLRERSALATITGTFMGSWLEGSRANGGRVHPQYNQIRNPAGYGTRTGRLSSSTPNFQNIPNKLGDRLPLMKSYLLPEEGHVWTCGDFKAQEPRIAAHLEDGPLCLAFQRDPQLDPYQHVVSLLSGAIERREAKVVFLGLLYSMGVNALAARLGCTAQRATELRQQIRDALPKIQALDADCKLRFHKNLPLTTLGGRVVHCEPPSNGRSWEYKALNLLVQGSAADQTKEALIYADRELRLLDPAIRILGSVHDEWSVSHPPEYTEQVYSIMQAAANALRCDVPMVLDIRTGSTWAQATK
jgi:DNA polymerase I